MHDAISDDTYQLKVVRCDAAQDLNLPKYIVIQGAEWVVIIDSRNKVHQDHLGIPFSSVPWLAISSFARMARLYDDQHRCAVALG